MITISVVDSWLADTDCVYLPVSITHTSIAVKTFD